MTAYVKNASVPPHLIDDRDPPAIAQLKEDHQIFRALLDLVENVGENLLFPIAGEICIRLAIHMTLEEEILYPSLKAVVDPYEIEDALLDHQLAKRLISDIMGMTGREESLRAKVHALGENVIRHIDQEDRELLLTRARPGRMARSTSSPWEFRCTTAGAICSLCSVRSPRKPAPSTSTFPPRPSSAWRNQGPHSPAGALMEMS